MTITATSTRKSYVETGCSAAEVTWNVQEADSFRRLMIEALGRDCVCQPGGHCWLLESAIKVLKPRALEDGLVSAFAAVQKDANEDGDRGRPGRVDRLRGGHGSRAGRRSCRGTSPAASR